MPETTSKKMVWDKVGERLYETGVEQVGLYPQVNGTYPAGVPWNGVTALNITPEGAEPNPFYANNKKYLVIMSKEEVGVGIEAYTYPDEFRPCLGYSEAAKGIYVGQQAHKPFGLVGKNLIGNDTEGTSHGYKLHLLYGCLASPSENSNATVNESPEPKTMSWECNTTPVSVAGFDPASHIELDSTTMDAEKLKALEAVLYGSEEAEPRLPLPDEVFTILGVTAAG